MRTGQKILLLLILVVLAVYSRNYIAGQKNRSNQPVSGIQVISTPQATLTKPQNRSLESIALQWMPESGKYGIVIRNLTTGELFEHNSHEKFESASLYKLWVMATVYQWIDDKKLSPDDILADDIASLNQKFLISSESAEMTEGSIQMSVEEALEKMITVSHNYAALLLSAKVRNSNIAKFLKDNDFAESSLGVPPETTASDTALFFEKLYQGEIVNKSSSLAMIELLKKQQLNDRIPKYVPFGTFVAHKTGELGYYKHDAGIVFSDKDDYIFVILSKTDSPSAAAEEIANLSKIIYDYFSSNGG